MLLDRQEPKHILDQIQKCIEQEPGTRVADLHVWSIGPGKRAAIVAVAADSPRGLGQYRRLLPNDLNLVHVTIEVTQ